MYYVKPKGEKEHDKPESSEKTDNHHQTKKIVVHELYPLSDKEKEALLVLQWCLVIARIQPDSPRLAWYCSRWHVPEKVAAAAAAGTLDSTLATCPTIDRKHLPAGIAAVAAWHDYLRPDMVRAPDDVCLHPQQSTSEAA